MKTKGLLISGMVTVGTVFLVVAYSVFNVLGVTQSRVVRNELTIVTASDSKYYDGESLSNDEWTIQSGELAEGDTIVTVMNTSITDPGTIPNEIGVTILDGEGRDVTINYKINYNLGLLHVEGVKLTIMTDSDSKYFDGAPLENDGWNILNGNLLEGHTIEVGMGSSIVEPGSIKNEIDVHIFDAFSNDVTHIYEITYNLGNLEVNARNVTVATSTFERGYNGEPLYGGNPVINGDIAPNNTYEFGPESEITIPGTIENSVELRIYDENNNDVTSHYNITYKFGTLTVHAIDLVIESPSESKTYDGSPLQNNNWVLANGNVAPTHNLIVNVDNTLTNVGEVENTIYVTIQDASGTDVSELYNIELIPGTLTVTPRTLLIETGSDFKMYDASPLSSNEWNILIGSLAPGHTMSVSMSSLITEPGEIENEIEVEIYDAQNHVVTDNYDLDMNLGTLEVLERDITVSTATLIKPFDGEPLLGGTAEVVMGELASNHTISFGTEASLLYPDSIRNDIDIVITDQNGNNVTSYYNIQENFGTLTVQPVALIVRSYNDSKVYDGEPLSNNEWEVSEGEVQTGHTLIVENNSEITLPGTIQNEMTIYVIDENGQDVTSVYSIEKIEGSLTVYTKEITLTTGTINEVYSANQVYGGEGIVTSGSLAAGHTIEFWDESSLLYPDTIPNEIAYRIIDENGQDVTDGYDVTEDFGSITVYPITIIIKSPDASKHYDGTPLSANDYEILQGSVLPTHSLVVDIDNEIIDPGTLENEMIVFILDENGVDVTDGYNLEFVTGTLEILPIELVISTITDSKAYDGLPLLGGEGIIESGSVHPDHTLVWGEQSQISLPGTIDNEISVRIYDENGFDVTDGYNITFDFGELTIEKIDITVESDSDAKLFDGTALTNNVYNMTTGLLLPTHSLDVTMNASITWPGDTVNTMNIIVVDGSGNDVSEFYNITSREGILEVFPISITVSTITDSKAYDGTALLGGLGNITFGDLDPNHTIHYSAENSITNPGTISNDLLITIEDQFGNDVTNGYEITEEFGELTVHPIQLVITTDNATKLFDGTDLTATSYDIISGSVLPEHNFAYVMNSSILFPGTVTNEISVFITDGSGVSVIDSYDIQVITGDLTVIPIELTVSTATYARAYDGTPLNGGGVSLDIGSLVVGHHFEYGNEVSITLPGTVSNNRSVQVFDASGNNMTEGYDITYNYGDLTIEKIQLVFTSESDLKVFDGTPLVNQNSTLTSGALIAGHNYSVVMNASRTVPGSIENTMEVHITDALGNNVDNAYDIIYIEGMLTVQAIELTLSTNTNIKSYDGEALLGGNISIDIGSLAPGHTLDEGAELSITFPGTIDNNRSFTILDGNGVDVTYGYNITYNYGSLTISPIQIDIESVIDSKVFDGTALTNPNYNVLNGSFLPGHTLIVEMNATLTAPGTIDNAMSIRVEDTNGIDVSAAYQFNTTVGTLTVIPKTITVHSDTFSKTYDGTALTGGIPVISVGGLAVDHSLDYGGINSITEPNTILNDFDIHIFDNLGVDVTYGYDITYDFGTLTVTPITIIIESGSSTRAYDTTPLINTNYSVLDGNVIAGHNMTVTLNESITNPGSTSNVIDVVITNSSGTDVTHLYDVQENPGTLTVTPINITVSTISSPTKASIAVKKEKSPYDPFGTGIIRPVRTGINSAGEK